MSAMPLGALFFGASLTGALLTPWLFVHWGRKRGFLAGIAFGMLGTAMGAVSVKVRSPATLTASAVWFGAALGIGFYLRFAALEVVPDHWSAKAMTLVVSGGCLAAFLGPEAAEATRGMFGSDLMYLGVFLMTGVFNVVNLLCTAFTDFSPIGLDDASLEECDSGETFSVKVTRNQIRSIFFSRSFLTPVAISSLAWSIMTIPMSMLRVAMMQAGYTSRQSLRVMELHFIGMYAPGFFTGSMIQQWGPLVSCQAAVGLFACAALCLLNVYPNSGAAGSQMLWFVGMIDVGVAWNFAFTASTYWTTLSYVAHPQCKWAVQAANDCIMFLFAGVWITSSSFLYELGEASSTGTNNELDGWKFINWAVVILVGIFGLLIGFDSILGNRGAKDNSQNEESGS